MNGKYQPGQAGTKHNCKSTQTFSLFFNKRRKTTAFEKFPEWKNPPFESFEMKIAPVLKIT